MKKASYGAIVGCSGSGKTSGILIPKVKEVVKRGDSFLVTDPGNEILDYLGRDLVENNYNIITINLRNRQQSDKWNPLKLPYEAYLRGDFDRAYSLLSDIASAIFYTISDRRDDPFWDLSSRDLFTGLAFGLFEDAKSIDEINLKSIYNMEIIGNKKILGGSTLLTEYYESKKDKFGYTVSGLRGTVIAPSDTKSSILSVFNQKLRHVTMSGKYMSILCDSSFCIEDCLNEKTAFILQFEDEKESGAYILNVLIKQIYELLIEKNEMCPFYMFFDDFLSLNYLSYLDNLIMGAKRRNISLFFSINSISLLNKKYGEYVSNALLENCEELFITDLSDTELIKYIKILVECRQVSKEVLENKIDRFNYYLINKKMGTECLIMDNVARRRPLEISKKYPPKEIKCFDFESHVMEIKRKKVEGTNRNTIDFDELIKKLDKKIEELEKGENKNTPIT